MLEKRLNYFALFGVLAGLGLSSCGEKKTAAVAVESSGGGDTPAAEAGVQVPEVPKASPDARAKALGYAQYLPKETEGFLALYDGKGFVKSLRDSRLGTYLEARAKEEGMDLNEINEEPQAAMFLSLVAEEFFVAVGKGMPQQADNLVWVGESVNFHQMRMMVSILDAQLGGEDEGMGDDEMAMALIKGIIEDSKGGTGILETVQVPPLTIGAKVSDEELREQLAGMVAEGLAQMLAEIGPDGKGFAEEVKVKRGDAEFTGIRIIGEKLVAMVEDSDKEQMSEKLGPANTEKLLKIGATKNIVLATGTHHGYVVVFAGSDIEELQIAESAADSYASSDDLAFADGYLGKQLLSVSSVSDALMKGLTKHGTILATFAEGIKSGLADTKNLGDTRDMEVLLDLLIKQEKDLMGMISYSPAGMAVMLDEGLKMEIHGGNNSPSVDLNVPRKYASIGDRDGVLMFANWVSNEEYADKSMEYVDTLGEIGYLAASRAAKLDIDARDFADFKEGFGMFDEKLKVDLLELWTALRGDLCAGLGAEGAIVVDVKGSMPTVPGIPQVIVSKGKAPRIGVIAPVVEREKISDSWKRINGAAENILKFASEMSGEPIPMQKPMSSEKDDLKTWFMMIPFQNDDFVLSVSVDEQNFFASTSKSFVQDLSASLKEAKVNPKDIGAVLEVDFGVLRSYLGDWIALVDENAEELFGGPDGAEGFRSELPKIREAISATEELDSLSVRTRKENGILRSTLHFKVK
ncbi:MAG: hypothetical protein O3A92_00800 [Verrucomicrobia bacterium]|nr:hypothetical protein [Verrucomicrobiota bacterium]